MPAGSGLPECLTHGNGGWLSACYFCAAHMCLLPHTQRFLLWHEERQDSAHLRQTVSSLNMAAFLGMARITFPGMQKKKTRPAPLKSMADLILPHWRLMTFPSVSM